jgi:hypothetical protein
MAKRFAQVTLVMAQSDRFPDLPLLPVCIRSHVMTSGFGHTQCLPKLRHYCANVERKHKNSTIIPLIKMRQFAAVS